MVGNHVLFMGYILGKLIIIYMHVYTYAINFVNVIHILNFLPYEHMGVAYMALKK